MWPSPSIVWSRRRRSRFSTCDIDGLACVPSSQIARRSQATTRIPQAFFGSPDKAGTGFKPRRRLGAITKTGNGRARRALVEGAWAYRHPAKVSEHIQRRIDTLPKPIQDIGWKAQVRLCKRFRRLVARGKHPNVAVTAIARELIAFMWAIAKEVPLTT